MNVISVSQNDCGGNCQCSLCQAVEKEEQSPSGPLLRLVNEVAADIEKDYPNVAIDTLAYQYTRKPPAITRPRSNVIVRLCSIECSFAQKLSDPQKRGVCPRHRGLVADLQPPVHLGLRHRFPHYVQPFPNLRVLAPNIRFFVEHGCKGVFEEGNYQFAGGEMAELPPGCSPNSFGTPTSTTGRMREFLEGYYGPAAPKILEYIDLIHNRVQSEKSYLACYTNPDAPFLSADLLVKAEMILQDAEKSVADKPDLLKRAQVAHLPVRYVLVLRWAHFQQAARQSNLAWPLGVTQAQAEAQFEQVCRENNVLGISESGTKPESLRAFVRTQP